MQNAAQKRRISGGLVPAPAAFGLHQKAARGCVFRIQNCSFNCGDWRASNTKHKFSVRPGGQIRLRTFGDGANLGLLQNGSGCWLTFASATFLGKCSEMLSTAAAGTQKSSLSLFGAFGSGICSPPARYRTSRAPDQFGGNRLARYSALKFRQWRCAAKSCKQARRG